jgi:hypothetical protein
MQADFKSATLHGCIIKFYKSRLLVEVEKKISTKKPIRPLTQGMIFSSNEKL